MTTMSAVVVWPAPCLLYVWIDTLPCHHVLADYRRISRGRGRTRNGAGIRAYAVAIMSLLVVYAVVNLRERPGNFPGPHEF
ncbi:MAG: hypothetical protein CM15mP68_0760 [Pseudomonadota bacterium]|nr:MAG: hypothetical protein CM15mP68_0760 [Pseudomonadota bacterium]